MKQMLKNKRWDFCPESQVSVWWQVRGLRLLGLDQGTFSTESLQKLELLGSTTAMLPSHGSSFRVSVSAGYAILKVCDWLVSSYTCVSSLGEKYCLEICILPWSDAPISWGELALSSHTHLFGIQQTFVWDLSCSQREPCSLAIQKTYFHTTSLLS